MAPSMERNARVHFVASVKIEKVIVTSGTSPLSPDSKREVEEVTHLTVKAEDLSDVVVKTKKHLDIVADLDDDSDDAVKPSWEK